MIIALFFTKPLLNHFFMTSLFSMTILIRNLTIPYRSCTIYSYQSNKKSDKKVEAKIRIRMSDKSRFMLKFNTLQTNSFRNDNFFVVLFLENTTIPYSSIKIYLFHINYILYDIILIILANINSFPNILFQAFKFKFQTYHMLHMLKTYP